MTSETPILRIACGCSLVALAVAAYPLTWEQMQTDGGDFTPYDTMPVWHLPHQMAVCDLICTGTITSTNDGFSAAMSVDDMLWGDVASSNIIVRYLADSKPTGFKMGGKYLVMAFTNNWWIKTTPYDREDDLTLRYLYDYLTPTSRPPSGAVFDDCRIISDRAIVDFSRFETVETNYWPETRTFITNFINMAKIQHDERKVHGFVYSLFNDHDSSRLLPRPLHLDFYMHFALKYKCMSPDEMYGKPPPHAPNQNK